FTLDAAGKVVDVDPFAAMLNAATLTETLHMTLAAFVAVGFAVAGIHAWRLRKDATSALDRRALGIALWVGGVAAVLQPISGDLSAKHVAEHQPIKLAAMEGQFETERCAPLRIGGFPDEETRTTPFAIEVPCLLSFLGHGDFDAEVKGLNEFPKDLWPPVAVTHFAFQIMVGIGTLLALTALVLGFLAWRKRALPTGKRVLT
ncbi:MAG: cytochrome ubiquinol oxidase subunit I, partial [Anaerolineae bacterium]|nr:cytochrome ubiquinol oxidase subunit I [Anaerolineae bacterium]